MATLAKQCIACKADGTDHLLARCPDCGETYCESHMVDVPNHPRQEVCHHCAEWRCSVCGVKPPYVVTSMYDGARCCTPSFKDCLSIHDRPFVSVSPVPAVQTPAPVTQQLDLGLRGGWATRRAVGGRR